MIPDSLSPIANHLWQSTVFAVVAGSLTLALRKNAARVRYWIWMAASIKFLIPLSLLVTLGSHIEWRTAPPTVQPSVSFVIQEVSQPFAAPSVSSPLANVPPAPNPLPMILVGLWGCGFIGVGIAWWRKLRSVRVAVRAGSRLELDLRIPVVSSPTLMEPGVFGIFRPTLLLPEGIQEHLTPAQLEAIIAHELCHVRRRDNLGATIHMLVEAVFWFHPLVWWIRTRLVEEREQACDEEVLRLGSEPRTYGQGILKVCELYLKSPAACMAGVSGANLKRRIEAIMKNRSVPGLNFGKKLLLAVAGMLVASAPLIVGLARAQTTPRPAFDMASLTEAPSGVPPAGLSTTSPISSWVLSTSPLRTGGKFTWTSPLSSFLYYAYHLPAWRISGIDKDKGAWPPMLYTIAATMDADATEDQVRLMLQTLLVDRFKIVSHRETKELQGYALVVAKGGPKLRTTTVFGEPSPFEDRTFTAMEGIGTRALIGRSATTSQLADELAENLGTFVLDQTGLSGKYYFGFKFLSANMTTLPVLQVPLAPPTGAVASRRPSDESQAPSIFSAVQEQLGLRLEKKKGPVEFLVVDHYEKPLEN
jgi:bla regulator protein blaR1